MHFLTSQWLVISLVIQQIPVFGRHRNEALKFINIFNINASNFRTSDINEEKQLKTAVSRTWTGRNYTP